MLFDNETICDNLEKVIDEFERSDNDTFMIKEDLDYIKDTLIITEKIEINEKEKVRIQNSKILKIPMIRNAEKNIILSIEKIQCILKKKRNPKYKIIFRRLNKIIKDLDLDVD